VDGAAGRMDVVVADDHPVVTAGLRALLDETSGLRLAAACTDTKQAFDAIRAKRPAVALVKLELPGSFELVRRIRDSGLECRVVLFGAAVEEDQALEAMRLGVRGLLLKTLPVELIEECLRKVGRGERWIEKDSAAGVMARLASGADGEDSPLTPREVELARLAASGLRNREIASRLDISVGTVKIHLHNVYRKLGVKGRIQLVNEARTRGLI
jgi:two-component system nitrate/nitrite response regulator NarL